MNLKYIKKLFFFLGLAFLTYLIVKLGPQNIIREINNFGLKFIGLIALMAVWEGINTFSWKIILAKYNVKISYPRLYLIRQIGEAFNVATPLANIGGEPLKALQLKQHTSLDTASASVIVDKTVNFIVSLILIASGSLIAFYNLQLPRDLTIGGLIFIAFAILALAFFYYLQRKGISQSLLYPLKKIGVKISSEKENKLLKTDQTVRDFYQQGHLAFYSALLIQSISRAVAILEIYIIANAIGADISYLTAFYIASIVAMMKTLFFFIPAQIGVPEGTQTILFYYLGLTASEGLTVGVIRRIRLISFVAIWITIYWLWQRCKGEKK